MDVWLVPIDMSRPPVNITQHPYDQSYPRWSLDSKSIAFINQGRRCESDISYAWLAKADENLSSRGTKRNATIKIRWKNIDQKNRSNLTTFRKNRRKAQKYYGLNKA